MIVLRAKDIDFEVTYVDLKNKPDWFLAISPLGLVPVLSVDDQPLFESNAIAEYLDEVAPPRLHPDDPIRRARNRAWNDYVPSFTPGLSGVYFAKTSEETRKGLEAAPSRLARLERALETERGNDGPYFNGDSLCLVDASYAPFLQRFAMVEEKMKTGLLKDFPRVQAWSDALLANPVITGSVPDTFRPEFITSLERRGFHVASLFEGEAQAAQ